MRHSVQCTELVICLSLTACEAALRQGLFHWCPVHSRCSNDADEQGNYGEAKLCCTEMTKEIQGVLCETNEYVLVTKEGGSAGRRSWARESYRDWLICIEGDSSLT